MADKLTFAITVKLSETHHRNGTAVAQREGMCLGEFMRDLLEKALAAKEAEYHALNAIFGGASAKSEGNGE